MLITPLPERYELTRDKRLCNLGTTIVTITGWRRRERRLEEVNPVFCEEHVVHVSTMIQFVASGKGHLRNGITFMHGATVPSFQFA